MQRSFLLIDRWDNKARQGSFKSRKARPGKQTCRPSRISPRFTARPCRVARRTYRDDIPTPGSPFECSSTGRMLGDPQYFDATTVVQVKHCRKPQDTPITKVIHDLSATQILFLCWPSCPHLQASALMVDAATMRCDDNREKSYPRFVMRLGVDTHAHSCGRRRRHRRIYFGGRPLEAGRSVTFLVRPRRAAELATSGLIIKKLPGRCDAGPSTDSSC
jgi:hypothetical protein